MGRDKRWHERILIPLAAGTTDAITAVLKADEFRVDFIRNAINREIKRRGGSLPKPKAEKRK